MLSEKGVSKRMKRGSERRMGFVGRGKANNLKRSILRPKKQKNKRLEGDGVIGSKTK